MTLFILHNRTISLVSTVTAFKISQLNASSSERSSLDLADPPHGAWYSSVKYNACRSWKYAKMVALAFTATAGALGSSWGTGGSATFVESLIQHYVVPGTVDS